MKIKVQVTSIQKFDDHEEQETTKSEGEITYYNKGAILEFIEKYEQQELKFKVSILENKVIVCRNGQNMIFDLENKNRTTLDTPYGIMNMLITTNKIEIRRVKNNIQQIHLEYNIQLEESISYDNIVIIDLI